VVGSTSLVQIVLGIPCHPFKLADTWSKRNLAPTFPTYGKSVCLEAMKPRNTSFVRCCTCYKLFFGIIPVVPRKGGAINGGKRLQRRRKNALKEHSLISQLSLYKSLVGVSPRNLPSTSRFAVYTLYICLLHQRPEPIGKGKPTCIDHSDLLRERQTHLVCAL